MWASGAIAYDHSMSSAASPAQPSAPLEPDCPPPTFLKSGEPFGYTAVKFGAGRFG